MVLFKKLNLMSDRFPFKSGFDVIFCRNVMIYFDAESRESLVRSLHAVTKEGGYLFIGHSESLSRDTCPYEYLRPATYRKAERA
jgi:chemotaxis protein methyltransferase CheR